jgi:hypothetical protein
MFGILEAVAVPETGVWSTYEELIADLNDRMSKDGYKVVKSRSHRSRIGGAAVPGNMMIRADLVCDRGGRPYECKATKHKTSTKKTGCPWNAKAVYRKAINGWVLTITCDQHNHEPGTPEPPTPSAHSENEEDVEEETEEGVQWPSSICLILKRQLRRACKALAQIPKPPLPSTSPVSPKQSSASPATHSTNSRRTIAKWLNTTAWACLPSYSLG